MTEYKRLETIFPIIKPSPPTRVRNIKYKNTENSRYKEYKNIMDKYQINQPIYEDRKQLCQKLINNSFHNNIDNKNNLKTINNETNTNTKYTDI